MDAYDQKFEMTFYRTSIYITKYTDGHTINMTSQLIRRLQIEKNILVNCDLILLSIKSFGRLEMKQNYFDYLLS
jgi:hypothetical protein